MQEIQSGYDAQARIDSEQDTRRAIIDEALTWLDTPFFDKQMVKGVGCDCATFIYKVLVPRFTPNVALPDYPVQWFLNNGDELYMDMLHKCGFREITEPTSAGDLFLVKFGRTFAHGGIIMKWPRVIFANPRVRPPKVMINDYHDNPMFMGREVKFFSLFTQT